MCSHGTDTYLMTRTPTGELVRYVTSKGRPAIRREWGGWKAGLPGASKPDPDRAGPRAKLDNSATGNAA